ncbi:MAG: transcription-repair coupling factor [Planctomycetes bacterium]|nr:transcription-repair coupling factor [Planctomycetota bacterium]
MIRQLQESNAYTRILPGLAKGKCISVDGLWGAAGAYLTAALSVDLPAPVLLIVAHLDEAEETTDDINLFRPGAAQLFPAWEILPEDDTPPDSYIIGARITIQRRLLFDRAKPPVIVAPIQAVLQPVLAPGAMRASAITVKVGDVLSQQKLIKWLDRRQFERSPQATLPGEFALRGGILDVFPFSSDAPFRIEFFGDEIESIREFDPELQTSDRELGACQLVASERTIDRAALDSILSYLPEGSAIAVVDPEEVISRAESSLERLDEGARGLMNTVESTLSKIGRHPLLTLTRLPLADDLPLRRPPHEVHLNINSLSRFEREIQSAVEELGRIVQDNDRTVVLCNNDAERDRLEKLIEGKIADPAKLSLEIGRLTRGFEFVDLKLAVLPHHEIFQRYQLRRRTRPRPAGKAIQSFLDLEVGDYVVHVAHGIGRFLGMEMLEQKGERQEFLALEYEDHVKLYVPASKIELVSKYIGGTDRRPRLSKIGGTMWQRRKEQAQEAVEDLAAELLRIQALRAAKKGIRYPETPDWQHEFEAAFIYTETDDQVAVSEEIKHDMTDARPMDRLICGDVGYGKTELAMRAAFRAVMAGKQVGVLVPTTILAQQHFRTFTERMADYPIRIEMLSRFRTKKEQGKVVEDLREGTVDIVIGTHRLVQKDVAFKDLGLVIIDEEQRFGVVHKERLKKLRETVDILTLTATPIPRTLHMALLGIRDISSLQTPPRDRLAIQTRLWRFDPHRIRQAILRELGRDGQVFFVHNRVHNIENVARTLRDLVPEAEFTIAHGQMSERTLEQRMTEFVEGKSDVLVSTTIIESGLDIPNANTIFVNNADHFGLADLHQLRGRVGRYKHRAYAYFLMPRHGVVNPAAEKRLKAIEEFADLGAGFKIAMRDLEIRGAGNILGAEQSGHIHAIGYDMYCRLLEVAVRRARNEEVHERPDISITIGLTAFFPEGYVPDAKQKIEMYRKLSRVETLEEIESVRQELLDRFGPLPREAENLLAEARVRLLAGRAGIKTLSLTGRRLVIESVDPMRTRSALGPFGNRVRPVTARIFHLLLPESSQTGEGIVQLLAEGLGEFE